MDLFTKENITIADIQSLIDNGIGESLNLEYKSAAALKKDDAAKVKITKSVSAFANSNGGVLIYGVHEEDQQPKSITYIDGNIFTNEWLEQIISNIHRKIKVEIIPVRLNDEISQTIYIVRIPESTDAPHMASDGKYYRRMNFQVVPMEEYEVRNLYFRTSTAELTNAKTFAIEYMGHPKNSPDKYSFKLYFSAVNPSEVVEKDYKMSITFENSIDLRLSWEQERNYITTPADKPTISTTAMIPIFPEEELCIMIFKIIIKDIHIEENLLNAKLVRTLHHSSGTITTTNDFIDIFRDTMLKNEIITTDNKFNPASRGKQYSLS